MDVSKNLTRLVMVRRKVVKKRNLHIVNEHFLCPLLGYESVHPKGRKCNAASTDSAGF